MVSTDFGLRVKFDGDHQVEVTLPSPYKGRVCGLCGNYNGNPADDFLNPRGELEPDSTSLGNSWQVSNRTRFVPSASQAHRFPTRMCVCVCGSPGQGHVFFS